MEIAVIGWPARIALLIEESGVFDHKVVEKVTEGDDWLVVVHLREPVAESTSQSDTPLMASSAVKKMAALRSFSDWRTRLEPSSKIARLQV